MDFIRLAIMNKKESKGSVTSSETVVFFKLGAYTVYKFGYRPIYHVDVLVKYVG